jgi:dTDP-4-dehydrorhamnose reductase
MITLLGSTGYIGQAFAREIQRRGYPCDLLSRKLLDYTRFDVLFNYVRQIKPEFLINAAGFTGRPNVDACEDARTETLHGNVLFPQTVARVCLMTNTRWGHVSSGCIYSGAKVGTAGNVHVEKDLNRPDLRQLYDQQPGQFRGFAEIDEPNFTFRNPPCSFYSGTKALAEESLRDLGQSYIWRLHIPFDEFNHPRNFLTKIKSYPKVYDAVTSLSHRGEFVCACLDLWERRAPLGIYNVTNPGSVSGREVVEKISRISPLGRQFQFWKDDEDFYRIAARTPRSNCILDASKLLSAGVKMRDVRHALEDSLQNWRDTNETLRMLAELPPVPASLDFGVVPTEPHPSSPTRPNLVP